MGIFGGIAKEVVAQITPMLQGLVKTAVDEANTDLKADVALIKASVGADIKGDVATVVQGIEGAALSIPQKIATLIEKIPGVGPLAQFLQGL